MTGSRRVVLAIDDEHLILGLVETFLSDMSVRLARGAVSCRTMMEHLRPDLTLLDVSMPDLDGLSILRRIRSQSALDYAPAMMPTARADRDTIAEAMAAGADGYLIKPFTRANLIKRARYMAGRVRAPAAA